MITQEQIEPVTFRDVADLVTIMNLRAPLQLELLANERDVRGSLIQTCKNPSATTSPMRKIITRS